MIEETVSKGIQVKRLREQGYEPMDTDNLLMVKYHKREIIDAQQWDGQTYVPRDNVR